MIARPLLLAAALLAASVTAALAQARSDVIAPPTLRANVTVASDIVRVGAAEPVPSADRPDERGVLLDERVPRPLVASSRTRHQVNDQRAIVHRVGICLAYEPRAAVLAHFNASVSRCLFRTAPFASVHGLGGHRDRLPARGPGPVQEHRDGGGEQRGPMAIRVICQPGMPPVLITWTVVAGTGATGTVPI